MKESSEAKRGNVYVFRHRVPIASRKVDEWSEFNIS